MICTGLKTMSSLSSETDFSGLKTGKQASRELRQAISDCDAVQVQRLWRETTADPAEKIAAGLMDCGLASLWSVEWSPLTDRERMLASQLEQLSPDLISSLQNGDRRKDARQLDAILREWIGTQSLIVSGWEAVAVAEVLIRFGASAAPDVYVSCLSRLAEAVYGAGTIDDPFSVAETGSPTTLREKLMVLTPRAEAPHLCSLLLDPLGRSSKTQQSAAGRITEFLRQATDADGVPHAEVIDRLQELLTPLARATLWADSFGQTLWEESDLIRLQNLTARTGVMCQPFQGSVSPDQAATTKMQFPRLPLRLLLQVCEPGFAPRLNKLLDRSETIVSEVRKAGKHPLVSDEDGEDSTSAVLRAAFQSDHSHVAVMRSSLRYDADLIVVSWQEGMVRLRITTAGRTIIDGVWDWSARWNNEAVEGPEQWKCSCWFEDQDCVFVELEGESATGLRCSRQIMLSNRKHFCILTDSATSGTDEQTVQLTTALPVASESTFFPDTITREVLLNNGIAAVRSFPLWLQDDRIQHDTGQFVEHDGQLELSGAGQGGVTMPLALDWSPKRRYQPADWGRLTVTEAGRVCGPHQASGFRVRTGRFQVMLYRSLITPDVPRAVLGVHTADETLYARVRGVDRDFKPIVQVEASDTAD